MVKEKRIEVNAFTIMSNHIHLTCRQAGMANSGWTGKRSCSKRFFKVHFSNHYERFKKKSS